MSPYSKQMFANHANIQGKVRPSILLQQHYTLRNEGFEFTFTYITMRGYVHMYMHIQSIGLVQLPRRYLVATHLTISGQKQNGCLQLAY